MTILPYTHIIIIIHQKYIHSCKKNPRTDFESTTKLTGPPTLRGADILPAHVPRVGGLFPITSTLPSSRVILYTPDLCKTKHTSTEHFVADKLVVGLKVLPSAGAWVIDLTAKFTPPSGATFLFRPLITPQRFCDRRVGHTILAKRGKF